MRTLTNAPAGFALLVLLAGPACSGENDDLVTDVPRDDAAAGDDADSACNPAACDYNCLASGTLGGNCRAGACVCFGGADADADADADAEAMDEADADVPVEADTAADTGRTYTCFDSCRNGSEVCDDLGFRVPSPYVPLALVCLSARGGVIYVSTNTGPPCSDGIPRCQGWEERGENAWDHLNYLARFPCTEDGRAFDIDLSAYEGEWLYAGAHDDPARGRDTMMTEVCIATWD